MKYNYEQRVEIGRQLVTHEITRSEALLKYTVGETSLDKYIRLYKIEAGIIPTPYNLDYLDSSVITEDCPSKPDIQAYLSMSKEQLVNELIRSKINEARAKKGYEVKGDGPNQEFNILNNKNSK